MNFVKFKLQGKGVEGEWFYSCRQEDVDEVLQVDENITVIYVRLKYKRKTKMLYVCEPFETVLEKLNKSRW